MNSNPRAESPSASLNEALLFSQLGLSSDLVHTLSSLGYHQATPIQAQTIPLLLKHQDVLAQSKTGSGKTLAFGLPIIAKIDITSRIIQSLILCPTRELCTQVARELRRLGRDLPGLQVLIASGGLPPKPQALALENGVHIVVGTPGRVLDHIRRGRMDLSQVQTLVLDEADRMLDMGFEEDMQQILNEVPDSRQTAFFSATYPRSFDVLSKTHQNNPVRITTTESKDAIATIQHFYSLCMDNGEEKVSTLLRELAHHQPTAAFIFCNLKATVSELTEQLSSAGFSVGALHGDLEQSDRDKEMAKFRNGSTRILVATDVASRGLDIADLPMVICFDLPHQADDYVHRAGRTGRAGNHGMTLSLVTPVEMMRVHELESRLKVKFSPSLASSASQRRDARQAAQPLMATLCIQAGRKEKLRAGDIVGALTGEAGGFQSSDIGKIEIHDHVTYVAVSTVIASSALQRLRSGRIKGRRFLVHEAR